MQRLQQEIDSINNKDVKDLCIRMLEKAPAEFWSISASASGMHHPEQSNGEGGLIQHCKMLCSMAEILCRAYDITGIQRDEIICACILHDLHKPHWNHAYITAEWMRSNHGLLRDNVGVSTDTYTKVMQMIRYHMGRWTKTEPKKIEDYSKQEWIVHLADMVVTNQKLTFKF